jgi:hypothetical protein
MVSILATFARWSQKRFLAIGIIAGICVSGTLVWSASNAAFTGYTTNPTNTWTTGTVSLTDDDTGVDNATGTAMFNAAGLVPGSTGTRCIRVSYTGNASAGVRLYSSAVADSTPSLLQYVTMTITEGTGTAEFDNTPDCTNFTPDSGSPTLYNSTLEPGTGFTAKTTWATGVYNTSTPWTPSGAATKVYKFVYTLSAALADNTLQGKTATVAFRWEAKTA